MFSFLSKIKIEVLNYEKILLKTVRNVYELFSDEECPLFSLIILLNNGCEKTYGTNLDDISEFNEQVKLLQALCEKKFKLEIK